MGTLAEDEVAVKKKIDAPPEISLEDLVAKGGGANDIGSWRVNLPACPELVKASVLFLRRKHGNLSSLASVCRYVSKRGVMAVQAIEELKVIEKEMRDRYVTGNELDRLLFSGRSYPFENRLGFTKHRVSCYLFEWPHGAIVDISHTLGLPVTTLTIMTLVFGLSKSEKWIPQSHQQTFVREAERFTEYVEGRARDLF